MKNTVKINGTEYKVRNTLRAVFRFEEVTERAFEIKNTLDSTLFYYCVLLANNPDMTLTWDGFIDAIDSDREIPARISSILTDAGKIERMLEQGGEGEGEKKN